MKHAVGLLESGVVDVWTFARNFPTGRVRRDRPGIPLTGHTPCSYDPGRKRVRVSNQTSESGEGAMKYAPWCLGLVCLVAGPAIAQPYCYETTLNLQAPVSNPDGISTVIYTWSTSATSGTAGGTFLVSKTLNLRAGGSPVYTDVALVGGLPQPMGGVARTLEDIGIDFDLDRPLLRQMVNVSEENHALTSGVHYQVADGLDIPTDGQVWIHRRIDGASDWLAIDLVASQQTWPDHDCNGTPDPLHATSTNLAASPNPSAYGQAVDLTANVTSAGGDVNGWVEFRDDGSPLGEAPVAGGQAILSTSAILGGARTLTAHFLGSAAFAASNSANLAHDVSVSDALVSLTSSAEPATHGEPVTFTATLTAMARLAEPGGFVIFRNGNTVVGTEPLDAAFQAAVTTSALGVGQHLIEAEFTGNSSLNPGLSATLVQSVRAATATTLTSSANPALLGQAFALTARVTSTAGTPAGRVIFVLGGFLPVPATLNAGGEAVLNIPGLDAPGPFDVVAAYEGDGNRAPSVSTPLTQTIVEPTLGVSLALPQPPSGASPLHDVDLTASVGGTVGGPITYTFYCDRGDTGVDVTPGFAAQFSGEANTIKTAIDACDYPVAGKYTAKVIAERGGIAAEARQFVVVHELPVASFTFTPQNPAAPGAVTFVSTSTGAGLIHAWDFNGDGRADSASSSVIRSHPSGGTFLVTLKVSNSFGSSSTTKTVTVTDPTPHITSVVRKHPGFFLQGSAFDNPLTVGVSWGGASPGTVQVQVNNGPIQSVPFAGSSGTIPLSTGTLPPRLVASTVALTPVSAGGTKGVTRYESLYVLPYPVWLNQALTIGNGNFNLTVPPAGGAVTANVKFDFPTPHIGPDGVSIPSSIPLVGGRCGLAETFVRITGSVASTGAGTLSLGGQTGVECATNSFGGRASGTGNFVIGPPKGLQLTSATFNLGVYGTIKRSKTLRDLIPRLKDFENKVLIGSTIKRIGNSGLEASLTADLDLSAAFAQDSAGRLAFRSGTGTIELVGKGVITVSPFSGVDLSASASIGGSVTVGRPDPLLRSAKLWLKGDASINVHSLATGSVSAYFSCTWTQGGTVQCPAPKLTGDFSVVTPSIPCFWPFCRMAHEAGTRLVPIEDDYEVYGRYAHFEPRRLAREGTALAPEPAATTSLVINLFPNAAPHLADLGTEGLLLLWQHHDLADPLLQSSEIAWSRYDGTGWTAPELVADDTRYDEAPVAGVDAEGRVVAAWKRIKDPAFTTPIEIIEDLPLFETRFEVATATYDPTSGTWSPITVLTDDALADNDLRISTGPGGELLLTWLSSPGQEWVSTSFSPATVKYRIWNPATASFGAPGVVAAGLIGVDSHVAAFRGSSGVVLLSRGDPDDFVEDDEVIEAWHWNGSAWTGPSTFASGGFGHIRPQVQYDSMGTAHVVWLRGFEKTEMEDEGPVTFVAHELVQATLGDPAPTLLREGTDSLAYFDARLLSNANGNLTLLSHAMSPEGPAALYALIYDDEAGVWSEPRQLTLDQDRLARNVSAAYGLDGVLRGAYLSTVTSRINEIEILDGEPVEFTDVPVRENTDLYLFEHSLIRDLAVTDDDLALTPPRPAADDLVTADVVVHNSGDLATGDFDVALYVGDPDAGGTLIDSVTVAGPVPGGADRAVQFEFSYPTAGGDVVVVVNPDSSVAELTRVNNQARVVLAHEPPQAIALAFPPSGGIPLNVQLDGSLSTDPEGGPLEYEWIFGDGSAGAAGSNVSHTYYVPGQYVATLVVTDRHGLQALAEVSISVGSLRSGATTGALGVDKTADGSVTLTWGDSCVESDFDYGVYEGTLGDFASHMPLNCSTEGLTEAVAQPESGNRYFIVVPRNGTTEGSYGADSAGVQRAASTAACVAQDMVDCASDCCDPRATPGCSAGSCEEIICALDAFCCDTAWDEICVTAANLEPACAATCEPGCAPFAQWASSAFASSEYSFPEWAAIQATGIPDSPGCGDQSTAWSPLSSGPEPEWLEVEYTTPVYATGVEIYETWVTGGVYRIEVRDTAGELHLVWADADPTVCAGVLSATWPETPYLVRAVRIHTQIADWEEIDAVELFGVSCY